MGNNQENDNESIVKNLSGKTVIDPEKREINFNIEDIEKLMQYFNENKDHLDMENGCFKLMFDLDTHKLIKIIAEEGKTI